MSYKLVVSDLDGTLLTTEHRVGDYTRRVLRRLGDRGVELAIASGRHFQDVHALAKLFGDAVCIISSNGAAVYSGKGEVMEMTAIESDCLNFLLFDPAFASVHTNVFCAHEWLVARAEPRLLVYHAESGFAYRVADFQGFDFDGEPVLKVFFYGENPALRALEDYIAERCGRRLTTTFSLPVTLEVMAGGVSKGAALGRLCARRNLDPSEVIAFGDGLNDLEMLRAAGSGMIMGNADSRLKSVQSVYRVFCGNDDEAVARYLESIFGDE